MERTQNLVKSIHSDLLLYVLLIAISISAPAISYSGVSLIYPDSSITANVNASPPITWSQGADYLVAQSNGFSGSFLTSDNAAAFTLTVSGLSGGTVTIDKLVNVIASSGVATFKLKISSSLSGSLTVPNSLKLRFWTGSNAPTVDGDAIAVLDLTATLGTETATAIPGNQTIFVQLVCTYATGTTGSSSVSMRPSNIILA